MSQRPTSEPLTTRLGKVSLATEESIAYWRHADVQPTAPLSERAEIAFEQRWFGSKSMRRVTLLLRVLASRFDAWPGVLQALHRLGPTDPAVVRNLCHWHVQLTDPLYRRFTDQLLADRWAHPQPHLDREIIVRWLDRIHGEQWTVPYTQRIASGLLSTAAQAGLCATGMGKRSLLAPQVSDVALSYLLYLLREIDHPGSLLDHVYLRSVALTGPVLQQRLRRLAALDYRRNGDLHDFGWNYPDLQAFAEATA